jgi:nucleotide-binding universal stress UspA family protein
MNTAAQPAGEPPLTRVKRARAVHTQDACNPRRMTTVYRHLLVPVDGTLFSDSAMRSGVGLAHAMAARVTGLIVEPEASLGSGHSASHYLERLHEHTSQQLRHASQVMSRFAAMAQAQGVPFCGHYVCTSRIEDAIAEIARREGCDLVVMSTHARTGLDGVLKGSRTQGVLARTELPVLVLR